MITALLSRVPLMGYGLIAIVVLFSGLILRLHLVTAERDKARTEVSIIANQLRTQNEGITKWQKQSVAQVKALKEAELKLNHQEKLYHDQLQHLLAQKVPANCKEAREWGAAEAKKLSQQWR